MCVGQETSSVQPTGGQPAPELIEQALREDGLLPALPAAESSAGTETIAEAARVIDAETA